ncbi:MAG: NAD(P)-dependent oxidoreductase [Terrimicrobiaceae bacterium]|nr:NAD(P)-dependent oxidoreductase [Terrimicrobiaceae bacterium]
MSGVVAVAGAGGFLGTVLSAELAGHFPVRLNDLGSPPAVGEPLPGDLCDAAVAEKLVEGASALVINHMLPRTPDAYSHPKRPIDVNVTGTAGLLDAAARHGCRRIILISSTEVVGGDLKAGQFLSRSRPPSPVSLYGLTKTMQEEAGRYFHRIHGLEVIALRPAYVTDEDTMRDKYGRHKPSVNWQFIDRRDIASAVVRAIQLEHVGFEIFHVLGHPDADQRTDVGETRRSLSWEPLHRFKGYPVDS